MDSCLHCKQQLPAERLRFNSKLNTHICIDCLTRIGKVGSEKIMQARLSDSRVCPLCLRTHLGVHHFTANDRYCRRCCNGLAYVRASLASGSEESRKLVTRVLEGVERRREARENAAKKKREESSRAAVATTPAPVKPQDIDWTERALGMAYDFMQVHPSLSHVIKNALIQFNVKRVAELSKNDAELFCLHMRGEM